MKSMKKVLTAMLALVMAFALSIPAIAFAEGEADYSITINAPENNKLSIKDTTYDAYKLFNVKYNKANKAYTYTVDAAFKDFSYEGKSGADLVNLVSSFGDNSSELNAFAAAAWTYISTNNVSAAKSVTANSTTATIDLDDPGYYLVYGKAKAPADEEIVAACALTTAAPKTAITPKLDAPSIDKVIVNADSAGGNADGKGTAVNVGDKVGFKLVSKVPTMTGYTTYQYIVNDTLSNGLTFNNDVTAKIDGTEVNVTVTLDGQKVAIDFGNLVGKKVGDKAFKAGDEIVITYSATLNQSALTTDVETNTVNLQYSNDPYDNSKTTKTPDKVVYVYDFDIVIDKVDPAAAEDSQKLAGAEFVLYRMNGQNPEYYVLNSETKAVAWTPSLDGATKLTTNANGAVSFTGLDAGSYKLKETVAPDGYNMLLDDPDVVITAEYNEDGTLKSSSAITANNGQYSQTKTVENNKGAMLPSTGGIGTTIFYVVGGIIVVGAIVALVLVRRRAATK